MNTTEDDLINPEQLDRIKDGVKMLIGHINAQDKILVQVDSDADGYTSAAFLINYLNRLFPAAVQNNFLYRVHDNKSHGIVYETVPEDVKLVIAPDSSSNDYDVHKQLKERGCDVLVIDHHLADHVSQYACVINNQMCEYPTKSLSGVGVVYKFCSYIDSLLSTDYAEDYLDLTAVGIIADVMDLKDFETRYLVSKGLSNVRNPFLKELCKRMDFKIQGQLNPFKVGFYVAPFINATNRSGEHTERILLFESMLEFKAYEQIPSTKRGCKGMLEPRVEQAVRTCTNVKNRQDKKKVQNTEMIENIIQDKELYNHTLIAVKLPKEKAADRNLTGLIATQIANKYRHPTAILNETEHDGEKWWEGSMRGAPHIDITDTREMFLKTGLVEYCEGHANAGGVGIKDSNFDALIENLDYEYADLDFEPCYWVDADVSLTNSQKAENIVLQVASLNDYWGQGIQQPYLAFTDIKITKDNCQLMKSNTFKITCGELSFIKFSMPDEEWENLIPDMGYKVLTIIGTCQLNNWNGYEYPQVLIEDYQIKRVVKYDF